MKRMYLAILTLAFSFGCQTNQKEMEQINDRLDQTRLRIYQVNLITCASIGTSCMSLAIQSGKDPESCGQALYGCIKEAEDTYRQDTKKDPPGFHTMK